MLLNIKYYVQGQEASSVTVKGNVNVSLESLEKSVIGVIPTITTLVLKDVNLATVIHQEV